MSCIERDMIEGYSCLGRRINEFLYEGNVRQGIKREHTKEELEIILEEIRLECWENYQSGSNHMKW